MHEEKTPLTLGKKTATFAGLLRRRGLLTSSESETWGWEVSNATFGILVALHVHVPVASSSSVFDTGKIAAALEEEESLFSVATVQYTCHPFGSGGGGGRLY